MSVFTFRYELLTAHSNVVRFEHQKQMHFVDFYDCWNGKNGILVENSGH